MLEIIKKAMDKALESGDFASLEMLMDRHNAIENTEDRKSFDKKMIAFKNDLKAKEDGHNDHSHFSYISYKELSRLIKPLQEKHGLNFITKFDLEEVREFGTTQKGVPITMAMVTGSIEIRDIGTGYKEIIPISAHAFDTGDKAGGKAKSEAHKRAIFKLLDVAAELDDNDSNTLTRETGGSGQKFSGGSNKVEEFNKRMLTQITGECVRECGISTQEAKRVVFSSFKSKGGQVDRFFGKAPEWNDFKKSCMGKLGGNNIDM